MTEKKSTTQRKASTQPAAATVGPGASSLNDKRSKSPQMILQRNIAAIQLGGGNRIYKTSDIIAALNALVPGGVTAAPGKGDHIRVEANNDATLKGTLTTPKTGKGMLQSCLNNLGLDMNVATFVSQHL